MRLSRFVMTFGRVSLPAATVLAFALAAATAACAPPATTTAASPTAVSSGAAVVNTAELPIVRDRALADSLLVDVRTLDPTIRVDARYATAANFTGAPLPGYEANRALLRREAAAALVRAQRALEPAGLGLLVWDAYRPVRATDAMVDWTRRMNREDLLRDGYIASRSRHNLGLAVDLTLVDLATGHPLDMGTGFDTFSAAAHAANATGAVAANRARLRTALETVGFAPYAEEWWHFSWSLENPVRFDVPITP